MKHVTRALTEKHISLSPVTTNACRVPLVRTARQPDFDANLDSDTMKTRTRAFNVQWGLLNLNLGTLNAICVRTLQHAHLQILRVTLGFNTTK